MGEIKKKSIKMKGFEIKARLIFLNILPLPDSAFVNGYISFRNTCKKKKRVNILRNVYSTFYCIPLKTRKLVAQLRESKEEKAI